MSVRPDVASVMTRNPQTIQPGAYINSAKVVLETYEIQQLPVIEEGKVVGLLTIRDIQCADKMGIDTTIGSDATVADIFNPEVHFVEEDEALDEVLVYMALEKIEAVLIMNGTNLEGIFTVADACTYGADLIRRGLQVADVA
jgi:IMP dehydrogenase